MPYQFSKIKVLVVESNNAMFDLTKGVLQTFGFGRVLSSYNVENAFHVFCRENPELVIVDWLSSEPNGIDLTRMIRTFPESPNPYVPIIMMTGYSQKRRVMMARDAGITEFVVKPFTAETLYKRIQTIIEKPRDFVKSPDFFGPDRRRKSQDYTGEDRRKDAPRQTGSADRPLSDRTKFKPRQEGER